VSGARDGALVRLPRSIGVCSREANGTTSLAGGDRMLAEILERRRLPQLDGLRIFGCAGVIVVHAGLPAPGGDVMWFFVLSGFLFAWIFTGYWSRSPDSISLRAYFWRRCCRILPAAYGAILFTLAGKALLHMPIDLHHAASAAFYYANYYNALHGHPASGFGHFWALSLEEQFYLVWPLAFVWFMRWGRGKTDKLIVFLVVAVVAVCAWRSFAYLGLRLGQAWVYNAFDCRFDCLAIGCLAGLLVRRPSVAGLVDRLSASPVSPLVTLVSVGVLLRLGETFSYTLSYTAVSSLIALFMLQVVCLHRSRWWAWLDNRVLAYFGSKLSYSMYLYHAWGLSLGHKLAPDSRLLQLVIAFPVTIGLAVASYYVVEKPFLRVRDRWFNTKVVLSRAEAA
jgi:peptidoglycan/LPS O-acetylase OafA/YrhL